MFPQISRTPIWILPKYIIPISSRLTPSIAALHLFSWIVCKVQRWSLELKADFMSCSTWGCSPFVWCNRCMWQIYVFKSSWLCCLTFMKTRAEAPHPVPLTIIQIIMMKLDLVICFVPVCTQHTQTGTKQMHTHAELGFFHIFSCEVSDLS